MSRLIAVIEDSKEDRFFLRRALSKVCPDCEVIEFTYADEALAFLRSPGRGNVDFIFVDINMPRMSGFEFVDAFEELYDELRGNTRVVMVSHSVDPKDEAWAEGHPAVQCFAAKPLSAAVLGSLLAS